MYSVCFPNYNRTEASPDSSTQNTDSKHRVSARHIIFRFMTILTIVLLIQWYYTPGAVKPLVEVGDDVTRRVMPVDCSEDFAEDVKQFTGNAVHVFQNVLKILSNFRSIISRLHCKLLLELWAIILYQKQVCLFVCLFF